VFRPQHLAPPTGVTTQVKLKPAAMRLPPDGDVTPFAIGTTGNATSATAATETATRTSRDNMEPPPLCHCRADRPEPLDTSGVLPSRAYGQNEPNPFPSLGR
jgi:hypothetical protein